MEIKEGKRYWTRGGGVTAPIIRNIGTSHGSRYWVCGSVSWFESGRFHANNISDQDLIAEYTGPELVLPLIPGVGKRYVTKHGCVTPAVAKVSDLFVWFTVGGEDAGCSREKLVREYLGKDDPINKETPCAS